MPSPTWSAPIMTRTTSESADAADRTSQGGEIRSLDLHHPISAASFAIVASFGRR
jgi:hypothetical protein